MGKSEGGEDALVWQAVSAVPVGRIKSISFEGVRISGLSCR